MAEKRFILSVIHRGPDEVWTERTRYTSRDEAIVEGRQALDMHITAREIRVDSVEVREGIGEVITAYRETTWRARATSR